MNTSEDSTKDGIVSQSCITTLYDLIHVRDFLCADGSLEKALDRLQGKQRTAVECSSGSSSKNTRSLRIVVYRGMKSEAMKKNIEDEIQRLKPTHQLLIVHIVLKDDKKLENAFREQDDRVTYYTDSDISQNILKHKWVPLHEKIDERERRYITKVYNVHDTQHQLPLISVEDPVVAFNGWQCGDIVRITRTPILCPRSGPASKHIGSGCGTYISYRYVAKIRQEEL